MQSSRRARSGRTDRTAIDRRGPVGTTSVWPAKHNERRRGCRAAPSRLATPLRPMRVAAEAERAARRAAISAWQPASSGVIERQRDQFAGEGERGACRGVHATGCVANARRTPRWRRIDSVRPRAGVRPLRCPRRGIALGRPGGAHGPSVRAIEQLRTDRHVGEVGGGAGALRLALGACCHRLDARRRACSG